MGELVAELNVSEAVKRELILGHQARMTIAAIQQERVGRILRDMGPARPVDGLGEPIAKIQPDIFWAMRQKFGADCWRDKGFLKSFLRKNPAAAVPVKSRKIAVQVEGFRAR